ncbi:MAG: hypothetical protein ACLP8B_13620 [Xanthobacteraceae bacterium]
MATGTNFLKLLDDPLVYVISSGWLQQSGFQMCLREAAGQPFHLLVNTAWHVPNIAPDLAGFHLQVTTRHPGVSVTFLCQRASDAALLQGRGLKALFVHRNALVDESVFRPDARAEKRYAAVHTANLAPFKRHALAWGVRRIALITYDVLDDGNAAELKGYEDVAWSNLDADGRIRWAENDEVAEIARQSHCGLILSAEEGGNFASAEYLFCGVPVISTLSRGGRHEMYDPRYVTIVPPQSAAVAAAVDAATRTPAEAEAIHALVLARAIPHRLRLLDWLSQVSGRDMRAAANRNAWLPSFRHKLRRSIPTPPRSGTTPAAAALLSPEAAS